MRITISTDKESTITYEVQRDSAMGAWEINIEKNYPEGIYPDQYNHIQRQIHLYDHDVKPIAALLQQIMEASQ